MFSITVPSFSAELVIFDDKDVIYIIYIIYIIFGLLATLWPYRFGCTVLAVQFWPKVLAVQFLGDRLFYLGLFCVLFSCVSREWNSLLFTD